MGASGSAQRVKIFQVEKKKLRVRSVTYKIVLLIELSQKYFLKNC
jgi:hypothetical protein